MRRIHVLFAFCVFLFLGGRISVAQEDHSGLIQNLKHKDPAYRKAAADMLGEMGVKSAVWYLIEALQDENETVRIAASSALEKITKLREFGLTYVIWKEWWSAKGRELYPTEVIKEEKIKPLEEKIVALEKRLGETSTRNDKLSSDVKSAEQKIQSSVIFAIVIDILFLVIIIYFTGVGASRLKMWKETIKQAEFYIKENQEITKRTDRILEELEMKKTEIMQFFSKVKEDSQSEVERFCELLETNLEHRMREVVMGLREKAEKEISQTLGELKSQVELEMKRLMAEYKEKYDKEFSQKEIDFLREVDAHTLFIEASFYSLNGKPEEALKTYNKLLVLKPNHFVAWLNKGNVFRDQARYNEALEAYQHALELVPDNSTVLYQIAATYARMRRKDKMLHHLSKAFQNDGEYKDEALNDISFREYWHDAAFKDLTEV